MKAVTVGLILAMASSSGWAAEQLYKWTDESGTVHYSKTPPEGGQAESMTLRKAPPPPPPPEEAADGPAAQRMAASEQAQRNLTTLKNNPTVQVEQEDGSLRTLGTEEREVLQVTEEKRVEMFCTPAAGAG